MKKSVYLDSAANSPLSKEVIKAMAPYLKPGYCGNSHSPHSFGANSDYAVEGARESIARILGVYPNELYFTSGATESNNWVIKGLALNELAKSIASKKPLVKNRIVCSAIEHASVMAACDSLKQLGFEVVYVNPKPDGRVYQKDMKKAMRKGHTLLCCCMVVNNETGASMDVNEMAKDAHAYGAKFLSDFTQGFSCGIESPIIKDKYPNVDYISFSSHKIYGPTGVGGLIRRIDAPLYPLLSGGSQESGLRGGTNNVAGIVGMAKAFEIMQKSHQNHYYSLYKRMLKGLRDIGFMDSVSEIKNGSQFGCTIYNLNCSKKIGIPNVADALALKGIACTAGAACSVGEDGDTPSHVLLAMGLTPEEAKSSIRISISQYTTKKDIDAFVKAIKELMEEFPTKEKKNDATR